jgi:hypothetical protein
MQVSGQLHAPYALPSGKNANMHGIGGELDTRADVDVSEETKY